MSAESLRRRDNFANLHSPGFEMTDPIKSKIKANKTLEKINNNLLPIQNSENKNQPARSCFSNVIHVVKKFFSAIVSAIYNLYQNIIGYFLSEKQNLERIRQIDPTTFDSFQSHVATLKLIITRLDKTIDSIQLDDSEKLILLTALKLEILDLENFHKIINEDKAYNLISKNSVSLNNELVAEFQGLKNKLLIKKQNQKDEININFKNMIDNLCKLVNLAKFENETTVKNESETKREVEIKYESETKDKSEKEFVINEKKEIEHGLDHAFFADIPPLVRYQFRNIVQIFKDLDEDGCIDLDLKLSLQPAFKLLGNSSFIDTKHQFELFKESLLKSDIGGLTNIGNSCYINACLKLLGNKLLYKFVQNLLNEEESSTPVGREMAKNSYKHRFNLQNALIRLMSAIDKNKKDVIDSALRNFRAMVFTGGIHFEFKENQLTLQQDGYTFTSSFLKAMEFETLTKKIITTVHGEIINAGVVEKDTIMGLDIIDPDKSQPSLQDILEKNFARQIINDPNNKLNCVIGGKAESLANYGIQSRLIDKQEDLFFQLKRFKLEDGTAKKIFSPVVFPINGVVDLAIAFGSVDEPVRYKIDSFEVHLGLSANSGHYTTYKIDENDQWWYHDDNSVTKKTEDEVIKAFRNQCYIIHLTKME